MRSPTAEATDLKSVKCGFDSHRIQIDQINPNNLNKENPGSNEIA